MFRRIVKRDRAIEMGSSVCDVPGMEEGQTHLAMRDHGRPCRALLFRQPRKLDGQLTHHVAVEGDKVCDPQAVKNGEQQKRIFRRLSESLRLFNQKTRPVHGGSGFGRRIAAKVEERGDELDLKLYLLAAQRGRAG